EKIASRKGVLPIQDKDFTIMGVGVANDDEVYVLAKIYEGKVEKSKKKIRSYSFKIFYFPMESEVEDQGGSDGDDGSGTDDVTEYELSLSEKYANSLSFKLTDQHLICSGFYGNKSSDDISGIFYMRINRETGEEEANDYYAFSKEFIAEFYPEKKAEK